MPQLAPARERLLAVGAQTVAVRSCLHGEHRHAGQEQVQAPQQKECEAEQTRSRCLTGSQSRPLPPDAPCKAETEIASCSWQGSVTAGRWQVLAVVVLDTVCCCALTGSEKKKFTLFNS